MLSTFVFKLLYSVFLTKPFFTTLLNLARSTGNVFNLSASILPTSVYKLVRFVFDAKLLTSTCVTFFRSVFVACLLKYSSTIISSLELLYGGKY